MLKLMVVRLSIGLWVAVSFIVCVVWGHLIPENLHMHAFLEKVFPGFECLTW